MTAELFIGTSGWSYPKGEGSWRGHFYPSIGKIDELEYYSQFFNTVEVNSSFYRPPNPGYVHNWINRTPDNFLFTIKLWQKFTHPKMYKEATGKEARISAEDVWIFTESLNPLVKANKLGALLAQFPPSLINDSRGKKILAAVVHIFKSYRLAVELRHRSWSDDPLTGEYLQNNNVAWVQIDEPKFRFSIAKELPITSDMVYFRFHGRNYDTWWKGNNETRYKYLYSPAEIEELTEKVDSTTKQAKVIFANFNNHWQGYAPRNALEMMDKLDLKSSG